MLRDEKARRKAWTKGLDVNRRTKTAWRRLTAVETDEAPSMEDRKEWLGSFTDQGRNELAAWQRVPGGEATRVVFICNMHLHCPVRVRLLMTAQHGCTVQRNEADHTAEKNEFERANSPLTRAEQSDLAAAITGINPCVAGLALQLRCRKVRNLSCTASSNAQLATKSLI